MRSLVMVGVAFVAHRAFALEATKQYKTFPQVWAQPWCLPPYQQIESQADCDHASQALGLTMYGPSNTNVKSATLPSCMIAEKGLRWNSFGLLDKNMTTHNWLGFIAICKNGVEVCPLWVGQNFGLCNSAQFGACHADAGAPSAINTHCIPTKKLYSKYTCPSHIPLKCVFVEEDGETLCENWVGEIFGSCNKETEFGACHVDPLSPEAITTQCIDTETQWDKYVCPASANMKCVFVHDTLNESMPTVI